LVLLAGLVWLLYLGFTYRPPRCRHEREVDVPIPVEIVNGTDWTSEATAWATIAAAAAAIAAAFIARNGVRKESRGGLCR
jgi:hypothetical protein